jgi:predicted RNase H-like HicB family nuclease
MKKDFFVVVEKDEDGFYVGEVPTLRACYAQGKTMEELLSNIREVIALCIEDDPDSVKHGSEFVGVQKLTMEVSA